MHILESVPYSFPSPGNYPLKQRVCLLVIGDQRLSV